MAPDICPIFAAAICLQIAEHLAQHVIITGLIEIRDDYLLGVGFGIRSGFGSGSGSGSASPSYGRTSSHL